jgi:hypothetical protein
MLRVVGVASLISVGLTTELSGAAGASQERGSEGFAGYAANVSDQVTVVQAQLRVPPINCAGLVGTAFRPHVEIVGLTSTLAAAEVYAEINEVCTSNGNTIYQALALAGDTSGGFAMTISPGDLVILRAVDDPGTGVQGQRATVEDRTTGVAMTLRSAHSVVTPQSVWVGVGRYISGSIVGPVPNFGTLVWVKASVDGSALGSFSPQAYHMVDNGSGQPLISTSPFSSSGGSFRNTWRASST